MKIKELREAIGMNQSELAKQAGVKQSSVAQWENGKSKPLSDKLPQLAKILHCSIDALFGLDAAAGAGA